MDNKINLSQLAERLAQESGMSKAAAEQFIRYFFDLISENVISDGLVKVKGFGTFKIIQLEDRESVNVNTGERFTIEGHQKISFTPDAELKERINKPFAAFDTVEITPEQAEELTRMDDEGGDEPKPVVKEVTQKKSIRFLLKFLIWLLAIVLVVALALYLLWPILGNKVLDVVERNMTDKDKTELVADSTGIESAPVKETTAPVKETTAPVKPAEPETKPEPKPQPPVAPVKFHLTPEDEAKELPEFTADDTVNYLMDGDLTVHVLKDGETITALALKYYGTKKLWPYIIKYNDIKNPGSLRPGAKIRIPVLKNK